MSNFLIYDTECFFCANYVRLLKLKETLGEITLIDARDAEAIKPFDATPQMLNEGMLLIVNDKRYYGAEAVHHIALLSTSNSLFNRINAAIFRVHWLSVLLYPALKAGRRLYLFLAGKEMIS